MAGHMLKNSKGTLGIESTCSLQPSASPTAKMFYYSVTNVWLHTSTIISSDNETHCISNRWGWLVQSPHTGGPDHNSEGTLLDDTWQYRIVDRKILDAWSSTQQVWASRRRSLYMNPRQKRRRVPGGSRDLIIGMFLDKPKSTVCMTPCFACTRLLWARLPIAPRDTCLIIVSQVN